MGSSKTLELPQKPISGSYREKSEKSAEHGYALDFVQYIIKSPQEREKLQDATAAEIVQAGRDAGYDFIESDLDALIQRFTVADTIPAPVKAEGCWS
jgi:hypothetical protein